MTSQVKTEKTTAPSAEPLCDKSLTIRIDSETLGLLMGAARLARLPGERPKIGPVARRALRLGLSVMLPKAVVPGIHRKVDEPEEYEEEDGMVADSDEEGAEEGEEDES